MRYEDDEPSERSYRFRKGALTLGFCLAAGAGYVAITGINEAQIFARRTSGFFIGRKYRVLEAETEENKSPFRRIKIIS